MKFDGVTFMGANDWPEKRQLLMLVEEIDINACYEYRGSNHDIYGEHGIASDFNSVLECRWFCLLFTIRQQIAVESMQSELVT